MPKYYYMLVGIIVCTIACILSSCFLGNVYVRECEKQLVNDSSVYEDDSGKYQIEFHEVLRYGDTYVRGGTWYEKNEKVELFTFVFGAEAGTLLLLSEDVVIASMEWHYDGESLFTVSAFSSYSESNLDENMKLMIDQTYVFSNNIKQ